MVAVRLDPHSMLAARPWFLEGQVKHEPAERFRKAIRKARFLTCMNLFFATMNLVTGKPVFALLTLVGVAHPASQWYRMAKRPEQWHEQHARVRATVAEYREAVANGTWAGKQPPLCMALLVAPAVGVAAFAAGPMLLHVGVAASVALGALVGTGIASAGLLRTVHGSQAVRPHVATSAG